MSEKTLRDTSDLTEAEFLALIEVAKIWQYQVYHSGGICRKSDLEAWLAEHFRLSDYAGRMITNRLTETYDPRYMDFHLVQLAGLAENKQLQGRVERAEATIHNMNVTLEAYRQMVAQMQAENDRAAELAAQVESQTKRALLAEADAQRMAEACTRARMFIHNGRELEFIQMPDEDDPAWEVEPMLDTALAAHEVPQKGEK